MFIRQLQTLSVVASILCCCFAFPYALAGKGRGKSACGGPHQSPGQPQTIVATGGATAVPPEQRQGLPPGGRGLGEPKIGEPKMERPSTEAPRVNNHFPPLLTNPSANSPPVATHLPRSQGAEPQGLPGLVKAVKTRSSPPGSVSHNGYSYYRGKRAHLNLNTEEQRNPVEPVEFCPLTQQPVTQVTHALTTCKISTKEDGTPSAVVCNITDMDTSHSLSELQAQPTATGTPVPRTYDVDPLTQIINSTVNRILTTCQMSSAADSASTFYCHFDDIDLASLLPERELHIDCQDLLRPFVEDPLRDW